MLIVLLDILYSFECYSEQMKLPDSTVVLERQLLLQLGDRLKSLRKARDLGTVEMAKRAGISRTTLSSVESGDPGPAIGTYLRVMSVLGISGELALLAGDALQPGPTGTAAARSKRARPVVQVTVSTDDSRHQLQDLQSLALHEEAIRLARADPELLIQAQNTLDRWLASGHSRSMGLWQEWQEILRGAKWRKVLGRTRRAQELRQASPLTAVLPAQMRQGVLEQVGQLRKGVVLGASEPKAPT
jgi:transcriptional regulator with XRE-family HTH domain